MSLNGQNGHKMVSRPKCGCFQAHLRIELGFFLWVSAWLIDLNESDNVTAQALTRLSDPGNPTTPRDTPPVLSSSCSSPNQFEYSRCSANATHSNCFHAVSLSLSLSVCMSCMSALFTCLSVCLFVSLSVYSSEFSI